MLIGHSILSWSQSSSAQRFLSENVIIRAIIPGPNEPKHSINSRAKWWRNYKFFGIEYSSPFQVLLSLCKLELLYSV